MLQEATHHLLLTNKMWRVSDFNPDLHHRQLCPPGSLWSLTRLNSQNLSLGNKPVSNRTILQVLLERLVELIMQMQIWAKKLTPISNLDPQRSTSQPWVVQTSLSFLRCQKVENCSNNLTTQMLRQWATNSKDRWLRGSKAEPILCKLIRTVWCSISIIRGSAWDVTHTRTTLLHTSIKTRSRLPSSQTKWPINSNKIILGPKLRTHKATRWINSLCRQISLHRFTLPHPPRNSSTNSPQCSTSRRCSKSSRLIIPMPRFRWKTSNSRLSVRMD